MTVPLAMSPTFTVRKIVHAEWIEYDLTASARDCSPLQWLAQVRAFLNQNDAVAVSGDAFGSTSFLQLLQKALAKYEDMALPWSFLAGRLDNDSKDGGYQLHAISGVKVKSITHHDRVIGYSFEDSQAHYALLSDLRPTITDVSEARQTAEVFEMAEAALTRIGMDFHDVVRTWFYLDRILEWYHDFNRVRTDYFQSRDIFGGIMPASTGVGAANLAGAALLAKVYAIRPKSNAVKISRVDSPLQCDAYRYGSAFSRAIEIADSDSHFLSISGTASIEPGGKTVHVDDVAKQMELTLKVVEAILTQQNMSWGDALKAIAYFRHAKDIPLWYQLTGPVASIPVVVTQCDVCRDDLLFEIELQAGTAVHA